MTQKITNLNTSNYTQEETFTQALLLDMEANGVPCKDPIQFDGKRHRYSRDEDPQEDEWYQIYSNYERGRTYYTAVYGTFSGGKQTWKFHSWNTRREKPTFLAPLTATIEKDEEEAYKEKLTRLIGRWHSMTTEAPNRAARYLERKKISNFEGRYGTRFFKTPDGYEKRDVFIVALRSIDGEVRALQSIAEDGTKRVDGQMKGHFHLIGTIKDDSPLYVAEGYATAASIYLATGSPSIMAVCCSNLADSIEAVRSQYKEVPIVIAADNDRWKPEKGNPGREWAETAATKWNCAVALPNFPEDAPGEPTDWNDWHTLYGLESLKAELLKVNPPEKPLFTPEELKEALDKNEAGDAILFAKLAQSDFLFYSPEDKFFYFADGFWHENAAKHHYKWCSLLADQYKRLAIDPAYQKKAEKRYQELNGAVRANRVLDISRRHLNTEPKWNQLKEVFPCANGLYDFEQNTLTPYRRDLFIRKGFFAGKEPVKYEPSAKCYAFEDFLSDTFNADSALVKFVQRLFGYIAMGDPKEHIFVVLYGPKGRNGKGILIGALSDVFGSMAFPFNRSLILEETGFKDSRGSADPQKMQLKGCRLATISELNKGERIDAAQLKALSSKDPVEGRSLFKEHESFEPTHTIVLQANVKPGLPLNDEALIARAVLIPFTNRYVKEPRHPSEKRADPDLAEKLKGERSGILNWLIEGAQSYRREGLNIPTAVRNQSEMWAGENDGIGRFIKEECEPSNSCPKGKFIEAAREYCKSNALEVPTRNEICAYMTEKGYEETRVGTTRAWLGVCIPP